SVSDETAEYRQAGAYQSRTPTAGQTQAGDGASGVPHLAAHPERGGKETAVGGQSVQRRGVPRRGRGDDAQAALSDRFRATKARSLRACLSAQRDRDHGRDGSEALSRTDADAQGAGQSRERGRPSTRVE